MTIEDEQLEQIMFDHLNGKLSLREALHEAFNLGLAPPF